MERIKALNLYQKIILAILSAMFIVFTGVYFVVSARVGYAYKGEILRPGNDGDSVVYSGRVAGEDASIIVTADKSVTFRRGENTYGPFTAREDPSALPQGLDIAEHMTGVEILNGESVFFRGGVLNTGGSDPQLMLFNEDGSMNGLGLTYSAGDGVERDLDGNPVDQFAPSAAVVLDLMDDPELTSKGEWLGWLCGVLFSITATAGILYADELFRWNLSFRIRNADSAEPSEWAMTERYIAWTALTLMALFLYIVGLRV